MLLTSELLGACYVYAYLHMYMNMEGAGFYVKKLIEFKRGIK